MYKILVVDDDPLLCNAMCLKIDIVNREGDLDLAPALTAHSAPAALELLKTEPVDILVTDVQMPYQSGLELIEIISNEYPDMQMIVLSGYSYYEYMRSALRNGVVDYLLKPVKLSQLKELLLKCIGNIAALRVSEERSSLREQRALDYEAEQALNAASLGKKADLDGLRRRLPHPFLYTVLFSGANLSSFSELFALFRRERGTAFCVFYLHDTRHNNALLINCGDGPPAVKAYLEGLCGFFQEHGMPCRCAVSPPFQSLEDYAEQHKQTRRALSFQLFESFTVKEAGEAQKPEGNKALNESFSRYRRKIEAAFQSRNFDQITECINTVFTQEFFSEACAVPADVRSLYYFYTSQVQETASALHMDFEEFRHFSSFRTLEDIALYCKELLYGLQKQSEKSTDKNQYIIDTIVQYINDNYNMDISMNHAANAVSMSYAYFSKFFKEHLYQSFSEYVTGVRMREAKRLLEEDPSIKIKDVANLVGYESVYSFSRAFKNYYHVPPKQTRGKAPDPQ